VLFHIQNSRPAEFLGALTSNLADRLSNAAQRININQDERLELGLCCHSARQLGASGYAYTGHLSISVATFA
jgi:hypothetical protein